MTIHYQDSRVTLHHGDCLDVLRTLPDNSVDSVVCDPPYSIGFMGRGWDSHDSAVGFQQWCQAWGAECLRVLKPGGHTLAFGGTRTFHRLASGLEDAGFEVRDSIAWLYGSGFPKSLDVSKAIDAKIKTGRSNSTALAESEKARPVVGTARRVVSKNRRADTGVTGAGVKANMERWHDHEVADIPVTAPATDAAREWAGWGTALKPAFEPVVVARKPLVSTVAGNVQAWGTGALNIDGCRIEGTKPDTTRGASVNASSMAAPLGGQGRILDDGKGRWPANVILDEWQEPVLRLRYNLPVEVERTIRESFGADTSHLPAMRDLDHSAAEQGAAPEVLHPRLPGEVDGGEPHGRAGATMAQAAHPGDTGADLGNEAGAGSNGTAEPTLEGRDVPEPGLCHGEARRADAGRAGDGRADGDELDPWRVPAGAPAGSSPDAGSGADERRARSPHQRGEGGQPAGEPGGARERGASSVARRGGARALPAASGEPRTAGPPLEVLRRECPPGWWQHFDVVGHEREGQAAALDEQSGNQRDGVATNRNRKPGEHSGNTIYGARAADTEDATYGGQGGASRFFYVAKAPKRERPSYVKEGESTMFAGSIRKRCTKCGKQEVNVGTSACSCDAPDFQPDPAMQNRVSHPTVKPLALMRWLVRLVTPPGGVVLEPFAGSGTTVEACIQEGFQCIAIEKGDEYLPLILERIARQDRARIEAEVVREVDQARAIAEQVAGQLDIFGEETA